MVAKWLSSANSIFKDEIFQVRFRDTAVTILNIGCLLTAQQQLAVVLLVLRSLVARIWEFLVC